MIKKSKLFGLLGVALFGTLALASCSDDDDNNNGYNYETSGSVTLSSHNWVTTEVKDEQGLDLDLNDSIANTYVGYAYYKKDGNFRIVALNDANKMYGKWGLINGDKTRRLEVYNSFNDIAYTRDVEVLALNDSVFTYRIHYDAKDNNKYVDVIHVPTTHAEPRTPAQLLAGTAWKTTNIYDVKSFYQGAIGSTANNNPVDLNQLNLSGLDKALAANSLQPLNNDSLPQKNYAGDAYYGSVNAANYFATTTINDVTYFTNGDFSITEYDSPTAIRSQGNWYMSLDGKYRTLNAVNATTGVVAWSRVVYVKELTANKFSYIIVDGNEVLLVEHKAK